MSLEDNLMEMGQDPEDLVDIISTVVYEHEKLLDTIEKYKLESGDLYYNKNSKDSNYNSGYEDAIKFFEDRISKSITCTLTED